MTSIEQIRNIAIVAHVDAGKTSITENLLFITGAIREQGSVDKGTAQTDSLSIERQRGISVKAALTSLAWKNHQINIIDSPGHADFAAEVQRSLLAVDAVVLVISAPDGIQSQTSILWEALKQQKIPTLIFINKLDRPGTDLERCIEEITKEISADIVVLQSANNIGSEQLSISGNSEVFDPVFQDAGIEIMCNNNEALMEAYLEGELPSTAALTSILKEQTKAAQVLPVILGSAKMGIGVQQLLHAIISLLPAPEYSNSQNLSGVIYRIDHDMTLGRTAGVRIFSGNLKAKEPFRISTAETPQKANQIKVASNGKLADVKSIEAGSIALLSGISEARIGATIGEQTIDSQQTVIAQALLTTAAVPANEADYAKLAEALQQLSIEDPELEFTWMKDERELHLKIMGWIQIDILTFQLKERFGIEASFQPPKVIYKETPVSIASGFESYTMPKPCWAVVKLELEPGTPGSGVSFSSKVSVNDIHQKYQNEVERTILQGTKQGIKGWELTDCKVSLVGGEDHEVHSRPGDFILATKMAIMKAMQNCGTTLLEPILAFTINAPESLLGQIVSDITQMRGTFESPEIGNENFTMQGTLPLSTSMDYSVKLTSRSGGKARIQTRFLEYRPCSDAEGEIRAYIGINPLDRSKFILKWRGAIQ